MNRAETAKHNFLSGCNCAQAVFTAFGDLTGLDEATAMKIASSFGGGMGRLREVCGAVSGMFMALGLLYGEDHRPEHEQKVAHYQRVQELAARFKEQHGSIVCRELLASIETAQGNEPERRTAQYYTKRPCSELCACAAKILTQYIEEHPI